jgi:hypothetical protein
MPYITADERLEMQSEGPTTPGRLNLAITQLILWYIQKKGLNYTHLNDVMGALESAKQEFYRRVIAPYEDLKKEENGDVYPSVTVSRNTLLTP